ncbi:uncharacterized protein LOC127287980 [Leptopilina boulardi]|uniref:uncharacterized protein LOC127287980 n=1 Tax=Leptopilina boulardi TaxID=63433 RepID=UPI0021F579E3|nr:uncharacterized protein LOC127287980 [Leptopilina boulardi]
MANRDGNLRIFQGQVFDNYKYTIKFRKADAIYYTCTRYKSGTCRARGVLKHNVFNLLTEHTHGPNLHEIKEQAFKEDLYRTVTGSAERFRKIYDSLRPNLLDASISVPFGRVENSMHKWRKRNRPPVVHSLRTYVETVDREEWQHLLECDQGRMSVSHVAAANSSEAVVIFNPEFVRKVAVNGFFFMDATFKVTPTSVGAHQLMTIMSKKVNKAIPIIWVLMSKKTTEAYKSVFQEIKRLIPEFNMEEPLTDYEPGLQRALREEFPGIILHGCHFHYCQDLTHRTKNCLRLWTVGKQSFPGGNIRVNRLTRISRKHTRENIARVSR